MTNFKGDYVTKSDVIIVKNYLTEQELQIMNFLVLQFLDFAELQALEMKPMSMENYIQELDRHLQFNRREILVGKGKISREMALKRQRKNLTNIERMKC